MTHTRGLLLALFVLANSISVAADSPTAGSTAQSNPRKHHALTTPANQASDASFDKRLPPVLPGEELSDSGKTVKVWSSSGPIPDNMHAPTICNSQNGDCADSNAAIGNVDVIIDRLKEPKRPRRSDSWAR